MIQVILKNSAGTITHVMHSVEELACVLNDPLIKAQNNLSDLFSYVMRNHYRTTINGINYYHSNASFGVNQPPTIVFTELDKPHTNGDMKIVLKDQEDNVIEEKEITLKELANLLNDPNILQCVNAAILEFYLFVYFFCLPPAKPQSAGKACWLLNLKIILSQTHRLAIG